MAYTTIDDSSAHFQTALWTGTGSSNARTNDGNSDLQPDLIWGKARSASYNHNVFDTSRGLTKRLTADQEDAEDTNSTTITAVGSDGFTLGTSTNLNDDGETYVGWQWKANGGTRTTNTESGNDPAGGYQANTTAGFSIVDYTGTGAAGTMAHGLGAVPDLIIIKNRDAGDAWAIYNSSNTSAPETDYLVLNTAAATVDDAAWWNDTAPTSTVFTIATDHSVNADGEKYIAYCFTAIQGYSKFGSYKAIGVAGGGEFIYLGFKPAWVVVHNADTSKNRIMWSNGINPFNPGDSVFYTDTSNAEVTYGSNAGIDGLSNGFKVYSGDSHLSNAGDTYIYMAFAEQPFVTSGGVPCTGR